MVAFDYLQILEGDGTARDERTRIAGIAEAVRRFAKRTPALVLAVSQSSRAGANALRKGDVVGADTATTGAESSQIERGAYLTIAIGEAVARADGSTDVSLSIGKSRFGVGDRVIPCSFDGATGRWRVTGPAVTAADHRAARAADKDAGKVATAGLAVLGVLSSSAEPMSGRRIREATGLKRDHVIQAIKSLAKAGAVVEVAGRKEGGRWPLWTPDRAAAAGLQIVERDE